MLDVIRKIKKDISAACEQSGRNSADVKLVAVSKRFPPERITEAYKTGIRIFGESRAQELKNKVGLLPEDIEWHFIGHLQQNKIKFVVPNATLIHSVDSIYLAEAISYGGSFSPTERQPVRNNSPAGVAVLSRTCNLRCMWSAFPGWSLSILYQLDSRQSGRPRPRHR